MASAAEKSRGVCVCMCGGEREREKEFDSKASAAEKSKLEVEERREKGVETLEVEEVVEHAAEKVWQAYVHEMPTILPTVMPGHFDTLTYVEGPPLTVGSVFTLSYHEDIKHYDYIKLRWDEINHKEHCFKCTLIEGGALNKHFSQLAYTFSLSPGPKPSTCVMNYSVEFVDIGDHTFHDFIKKELQTFCKSLESHLHIKD